MKKCGICEVVKELIEFGRDASKRDGLYTYCKECIRKRSKQQRQNDPEYAKEYARKYREKNRELLKKKRWLTYYIDWEKRAECGKRSYEKHKKEIAKRRSEKRRTNEQKEKERIRQAEWRRTNRSRVASIASSWKKRNPQKSAAHTLVLWAIRTGMLIKPEKCEECSRVGRVEGHHEDYFKPLEVRWLCRSCHCKKHRIYR